MSSFDARFVETTSCCGLNKDLPTEFKQEDVDAILAQGMRHLSFDELQREQEDLHGVGDLTEGGNDRDMLSLLQTFDSHLQRRKHNTVYESAELLNKDFVTNPDLRRQFLRGNRCDPKAAAEQFLKFLEVKKQLFGMDKVTKDLTLDDLDEDDKDNLLGGSLQVLPVTDSSGRLIVLELPGLRSFKSLENELRARFYMLVKLWSQSKRGAVWLSYAVGQYHDKMNGKGFVEMTTVGMCMPMHWAGFHLCTDDPSEAVICKATFFMFPAELKAKTRVHFGSHTECQYRLNTFGISRAELPFTTLTNDPKLDCHIAWYKQCLREEHHIGEVHSSIASQLQPTKYDVLFASGRKFTGNGNEVLRSLAMQNVQNYFGGNAKERKFIVEMMVEHITRKDGRFLKLNLSGSSWVEMQMPEVREKITQMLRNLKRSKPKTSAVPASHLPMLQETEILPNDVLFGRNCDHQGNQNLRRMVESTASEYDKMDRGRKKHLVNSLIDQIKASNGRFLWQVEGGKWQEVPDDAIVFSKVSSHFRNLRRYRY